MMFTGIPLVATVLLAPRGIVGFVRDFRERRRGVVTETIPLTVTKRFRGLVAINDVSLDLAAGSISSLIGRTGPVNRPRSIW
jgi:hypothetical protein